MELIVNGIGRKISDCTLDILESQFESLQENLGGKEKVFNWLAKFGGNDYGTQVVLRQAKLMTLATDLGSAFLRSKFPCPTRD